MSKPLIGFHEAIKREVISFDALWILGAGLGLKPLLQNIIDQYSAHKELIIVLNIDPTNFDPLFAEQNPLIVAEGITAAQRSSRYLKGGILFITSRILVVDMLRERLPAHLIGGFIVANAHRVNESSTESFILRLYRESNKTGFIKAFTEDPQHISSGRFGATLEKTMRALFVRKVFLWPRFKKGVSESLDSKHTDVTQASVPMTPFMVAIQKAITEVMGDCLKELSKSSNVDIAGLDLTSAFSKSFHRLIRGQLDPVWHQTSRKTKQLVNDLEVLRRLASFLAKYDAVSFFEYLDDLKKKEVVDRSLWLMMEQASTIFQYARARVFKTSKVSQEPAQKKPKSDRDFGETLYSRPPPTEPLPQYEYHLTLEQNPKWHVLDQILNEIKSFPAIRGQHGPILIVFRNEENLAQIRNYLSKGGQSLLKKSLVDFVKRRRTAKARISELPKAEGAPYAIPTWRGRARGRGRGSIGYQRKAIGSAGFKKSTSNITPGGAGSTSTLTPVETFLEKVASEIENDIFVSEDLGKKEAEDVLKEPFADFAKYFGLLSSDASVKSSLPNATDTSIRTERTPFEIIEIYAPFKPSDDGSVELPLVSFVTFDEFESTLNALYPQYIVMYDADLDIVRNIEIYKAYNSGLPCKVYFMSLKDSSEEALYKASVEREKSAFTALIKEKETLIVTEEQDGRLVLSKVVSDQMKEAEAELNSVVIDDSSRKGGQLAPSKAPKSQVFVDTREFRSKLPNLLHLSGFEVVPLTLEMGDYIITPDISIERKSIYDLHSSFQSGRLFTQAENLTRHYSIPVLLIEFEETQAFALEEEVLPDNINVSHIISKVVLLTQQFPKLRIIWSNSPYNTAQLIKLLKEGKKEPGDQSDGVRPHHRLLNDDAVEVVTEDAFDAIDMLKKMPGVTPLNANILARNAANLRELVQKSKAELQQLIGKQRGLELFKFLNETQFPDDSRKVRLND